MMCWRYSWWYDLYGDQRARWQLGYLGLARVRRAMRRVRRRTARRVPFPQSTTPPAPAARSARTQGKA